MNSQKKYKIQALIAEIDEVLSKPVPRLPWTGSMDSVHQRQLLERVRTYLVSPDSKLVSTREYLSSTTAGPEVAVVPGTPAATNQQAVDEILLAVTGEISHLREDLMQPLQEDIQALRQEHEALVREIQQLEAKRQQQQSLAQQQANQQQIISEFLQALTSRLQETLDRGALQTPGSIEPQLLPIAQTAASDSSGLLGHQATLAEQGEMTAESRLQQMQLFQAHADSLMVRLDSTMSIVFQTLEGNLQSYQESLSLGLEKMHGLGQQSEAMFAALVNRLAEQLGREASAPRHRLVEFSSRESETLTNVDRTLADPSSIAGASIPKALESDNRGSSQLREQERLPYAGTEMSPQFGQLRRDRDRTQLPISLPDLEENLFGYPPAGDDRPATSFPGAESEVELTESNQNVEDLYASLFAAEEVAELELEDFTIENTENAAGTEWVASQTAPENESSEPLIATSDLLANLLWEDESADDLSGENSDFAIANSVDELTLDTEDLFEPEVKPPLVPTSEPQHHLDEPKNPEIAPNHPARPDLAAAGTRPLPPPPPPPPAFRTTPEPPPPPPSGQPRVPSVRDVQTGEFGTQSQRVDDGYIQASPEEDLLPIDTSSDSVDRTLNLDNNTLQLLEADLNSMEGSENLSKRLSPPKAALNREVLPEPAAENPENPFAEAAAEELGSLDDLFALVSEVSSDDDEYEVWEKELDAELFNEGEAESSLSLDEILASLTHTEAPGINSLNQESEISAETNPRQSNSGETQKKN